MLSDLSTKLVLSAFLRTPFNLLNGRVWTINLFGHRFTEVLLNWKTVRIELFSRAHDLDMIKRLNTH